MKSKLFAAVLALMMVGTVLMNVSLVSANTPPPPSDAPNGPQYIDGNWTVAGTMSFTNELIYLTGNLTIPVGTSLTLVNTTIFMNSSFPGQFHVEVNGTLNLNDGGDGFTPMEAGDSDASNITANNTAINHLFWVRPTATMNVYDSSLQYAGININMPPNNESGVYIRSNNVRIEDSLIMNNNHSLIFDSCFPASFLNNNVSENEGLGLGIGNMTNPFYNITGRSIHDNIFTENGYDAIMLRGYNIGVEIYNVNCTDTNNGQGISIQSGGNLTTIIHDSEMWNNYGAAVYMNSDRNIISNVYDLNISENAYGVWAYANWSQDSRFHDSTIYRNDMTGCAFPSYGGAALNYDSNNGSIVVNVHNNSFIENNGDQNYGCFGFGSDSWNTTVKISDNYFLGNGQGSSGFIHNYFASNVLDIVMADNFFYGSSFLSQAENFNFDSDLNLKLNFLRNVYDNYNYYSHEYLMYAEAYSADINIEDSSFDIETDNSDEIRNAFYFYSNSGFLNVTMSENDIYSYYHYTSAQYYELFYLWAPQNVSLVMKDNAVEFICDDGDGNDPAVMEIYSDLGNISAEITGNLFLLKAPEMRTAFRIDTDFNQTLTFSENDIYGSIVNVDFQYMLYSEHTMVLNATIEDNMIEMLHGDFEAVIYLNSFELNARIIGNDYYGNAGINSYGGIVDVSAQIVDILIDNNNFVTEMLGFVNDNAPMLYLNANLALNATLSNNYFEYTDSSLVTSSFSTFVYLYTGGSPGDMRVDVTDNEFVINIVGGGGIQGDGILSMDVSGIIYTNISHNTITFNHYAFDSGDMAYLNSAIAIWSDSDMYANIMNNTINAYLGQMVDTANAVKAVSNTNATVNLEGNDIQGHWWQGTGEYDVSEFGVTIGQWGANGAPITQNLILTTKNNIFGPGGQVSAITVATTNVTDVTMDGDIVRGAYFGDDCGIPTGDTFGNGVTLLGETIIADLRNLDVYDNKGAGIYIQSNGNSTVDIADSRIHDNYWHGMYFESVNGIIDGTGSVNNVKIIDNGGDWNGDLPNLGCGIYCINTKLDVENSVLDNPDTDYEIGVGTGSNVTLLNCTFDRLRLNVEGTPATLTGGISPEKTIATWNAVTDGSFRITIDGISRDISGIDFSGPITMNTVALIIQLAINGADTSDGFANATCIWTGSEFVISSGTTGAGSTISTLQKHSGTVGTDISGIEPSTAPVLWWMDCASNATLVQGTTSHLFVKWYMHVKAEQQGTGFGLPAANVQVRDLNGALVASGVTGQDGICKNMIVTEYYRTNTTFTPYTPHNASATKGTASGYSHSMMDSTKQVVVVLDYTSTGPTADAGPDRSVDEGANFTLDGSASYDDYWIADWSWAIGATVLKGEMVNFSIAIPGVYIVNLTVTDAEGNTDTDEAIITVLDNFNPIADAGLNRTVNEDTTMTFDGTGSSDAAGIANYTWTFNDGTARTLYGVSPTHIFAQPGVYTVTLTVADPTGNTATDTMIVTVLDITAPVPVAGAPQTVPQGSLVTLSASGSLDNVGIVSYVWNFNDGVNDVSRTGALVEYRLNEVGNVSITLTCEDAAGNSAFTTTWVNVIDNTPPEVLVVAPGESLTEVPLNWALVIVFNEPMDTASVEAAFSITGGSATGFEWNADGTFVRINLAALDYGTEYTFTIGTGATDASGNNLTAPYSSDFTTRADPEAEAESDFMADNWWLLIVIIVIMAVLLLVSLLRGKKEPEAQAATPEAAPAPEAAPEPAPAPETPSAPAEEEIQ